MIALTEQEMGISLAEILPGHSTLGTNSCHEAHKLCYLSKTEEKQTSKEFYNLASIAPLLQMA